MASNDGIYRSENFNLLMEASNKDIKSKNSDTIVQNGVSNTTKFCYVCNKVIFFTGISILGNAKKVSSLCNL